ncbi:MAG: radical SAM protein [Nanoarchaeota archaeon]|mgnify:CR=1 FL=1
MKLALVSCRSPFVDDSKIYPPLGIMYLESIVQRELPRIETTLIDEYDLANPSFFKPFDTIGVSIMTPQRKEALAILRAIKENYPEKTVIAGGPHALHYFQEIEQEPWDFIVKRDGERDLIRILKKETRERVLEDNIPSQILKQLPHPNRKKWRKFLEGYNYSLGGKKSATMMTGRGCPEKCTFCEDSMTNIKWASPESIDQQVQDMTDLGYRAVYIFDDLFAISMKMIIPYLESMKKRGMIFRCNGQARYFTRNGEEMAKLLADHGCYEIAFGFESGSQKILDNVQKRTTVEQNYQSAEYARRNGIKVKGFMMLGLPGENKETIAETERFIRDSGMDDFQLAIYYPYRGTQIRDNLDKGKDDLYFEGEGLGAYGQKGGSTESVVRTSNLNSGELLKIRDRLVKKYKPDAHKTMWAEDQFFDTHLK